MRSALSFLLSLLFIWTPGGETMTNNNTHRKTNKKIAFGSCHRKLKVTIPSIWNTMLNKEQPNSWIWMGDATYPLSWDHIIVGESDTVQLPQVNYSNCLRTSNPKLQQLDILTFLNRFPTFTEPGRIMIMGEMTWDRKYLWNRSGKTSFGNVLAIDRIPLKEPIIQCRPWQWQPILPIFWDNRAFWKLQVVDWPIIVASPEDVDNYADPFWRLLPNIDIWLKIPTILDWTMESSRC
jgi:hypothetical protein